MYSTSQYLVTKVFTVNSNTSIGKNFLLQLTKWCPHLLILPSDTIPSRYDDDVTDHRSTRSSSNFEQREPSGISNTLMSEHSEEEERYESFDSRHKMKRRKWRC
uniref:Uncharacterized protein n=1 Tax=Caenorhabditis tropicalis TaxID=1561998 RepID=A0A1I7TNS1_9PELO